VPYGTTAYSEKPHLCYSMEIPYNSPAERKKKKEQIQGNTKRPIYPSQEAEALKNPSRESRGNAMGISFDSFIYFISIKFGVSFASLSLSLSILGFICLFHFQSLLTTAPVVLVSVSCLAYVQYIQVVPILYCTVLYIHTQDTNILD
jgi:hypothetical protein